MLGRLSKMYGRGETHGPCGYLLLNGGTILITIPLLALLSMRWSMADLLHYIFPMYLETAMWRHLIEA